MLIEIQTSKDMELVDITSKIESHVNIQNGICVVSTPHTTAGIIINENEAGLKEDVMSILRTIVPPSGKYKHNRVDNNAHSHIIASLVGSSELIPVEGGKLVLGTWQRVFLMEADGPRRRRVNVTLLE